MSKTPATMDEILIELNNTKLSKKYQKKYDFIKEINKISNEIVNIIKTNKEKNEKVIELDNIFNCDINRIKENEIIGLIINIDDISSFILLLTSLFCNYTSQRTFNDNLNEIDTYFKQLDIKYRDKINNEPKYNKEVILKDLINIRNKIIKKTYNQVKYVLRCYATFIMIPLVSKEKLNTIYKKFKIEKAEYNKINEELMEALTTYLESSNIVLKEYKKVKHYEFFIILNKIREFVSHILSKCGKILIDILAFIYFIFYGIKFINKRIDYYEKELQDNFDILRKNTLNILNIINESRIMTDLFDYSNNKFDYDIDQQYLNESNFSNSTFEYITFANNYINKIIKIYIRLRKYLYNERDLLNNIR